MALLPTNTVLGELKLVEVFAEHDFPVVFACHNEAGPTYIATWVTEEPTTTGWLYVPVSPFRLGEVRRKRIPLRKAFTSPETGSVYRVSVPKRDGVATAEMVDPSALSEDVLPTDDSFVETSEIIDDAAASELLASEDDVELAISGRPVSGNEVDIGFLGTLLRMVQDLSNAYGQSILSQPTDRASVGKRVKAMSRIVLPPTFAPGSFKLRLRLAPPPPDQLFVGEVGNVPNLEFIAQVLAGDTASSQATFYANLPRVRAHLYRLLDLVAKQHADLKIRTRGNPFGVLLNAAAARDRMASFTEVTVQTSVLVGTLPGASTDTGRFELLVKGRKYTGRTNDASKRQLSGIPLDGRVLARVRNRVTTDLTDGSVKIRRTLLNVATTDRTQDYDGPDGDPPAAATRS